MAFNTAVQLARGAARLFVDSLLPPQCLGCGIIVDAPGSLCADCFQQVTFITPPVCDCCGVPFEGAIVEDLICGSCLSHRPAFSHTRAAFIYNEHSKGLVLKLKHGDRTDIAAHLSRWLARAAGDLLPRCDVIIPVPLHRWRFFMRTYNQAALLAKVVGKLSGKPVAANGLLRVLATPSQGGLDRASRRRNVARAFAVNTDVRGKRVLLVDDVLTTGATADACAKVLLAAGAVDVDVAVLARVPAMRD